MSKPITPGQIKQNNLSQIYHHIYKNPGKSMQELSYELRLSRPTIANNLAELEKEGLIQKSGYIASDQVGRKAAAYAIRSDYRTALGIELTGSRIKMVCIDLNGDLMKRSTVSLPFQMNSRYYKTACDSIRAFADELSLTTEQILGIGIAVPALVSPDGEAVTWGKIIDCEGMKIDEFRSLLPWKCRFYHDAACAALSEVWASPMRRNFIYLMIGRHFGGAAIENGRVLFGKSGHFAAFEHIRFEKGKADRLCYCGNRGCLETVISMSALLRDGESAEDFFLKLRDGSKENTARWQEYLNNMAAFLSRSHMVLDIDYILGGYLAPYLTEEDISFLKNEIAKTDPFNGTSDFLHIGKVSRHNVTIGAALSYISAFLEGNDPIQNTDRIGAN